MEQQEKTERFGESEDLGYIATAETEPELQDVGKQQKSLFKRIGGGIAAGAFLIFKFFAKFKALLLILPKLKLLTTSATMLVSIAAYTLIWGWKFAVGFVLLLFVHEMGHYIQLRREGVKPGKMIFIPFLGAALFSKSLGGSALAEARVGLAGPVLGSLGAGAVALAAAATHSDFLFALAFTGFFLNLFNLVPLLPFDGGRAMAAMSPWIWIIGLAVMIAMVIGFPNPILILFLVLGALETWRRWRQRRKGEEGNAAYYKVSTRHRVMVGVVYIGLIAALALGMSYTHVARSL